MPKMSDTTPYSQRPAGERAREAECFRSILAHAAGVPCVLEAFGGIGDTTAILRERFPGASIIATELDPHTWDLHRARFRGDPKVASVHGDTLRHPWHLVEGDSLGLGIVLDYNLSTLKRLREPGGFIQKVLDAFPLRKSAWVTYTDAAIAKLHLNHRAYGTTDLDDYREKVAEELRAQLARRTGARWVFAAEAHHSRAMYIRMDRV